MTLIELISAIAIISLLTALIVPAIGSAREAARRLDCANRLHQISLAVDNYTSLFGSFPSARRLPPSTSRRLMPFMEADAVLEAVAVYQPHQLESVKSLPKWDRFNCPSDPMSATADGRENYLFNDGSDVFGSNGVVAYIGALRPSDVTDGLSNTAMICEKAIHYRASELNGMSALEAGTQPKRFVWYLSYDVPLVAGQAASLVAACEPSAMTPFPLQTTPGVGWLNKDGYLHVMPPNRSSCYLTSWDRRGQVSNEPDWVATASSFHPGGVTTAMGDGSVRFISDAIDGGTWSAIGTRAGGELTSNF